MVVEVTGEAAHVAAAQARARAVATAGHARVAAGWRAVREAAEASEAAAAEAAEAAATEAAGAETAAGRIRTTCSRCACSG